MGVALSLPNGLPQVSATGDIDCWHQREVWRLLRPSPNEFTSTSSRFTCPLYEVYKLARPVLERQHLAHNIAQIDFCSARLSRVTFTLSLRPVSSKRPCPSGFSAVTTAMEASADCDVSPISMSSDQPVAVHPAGGDPLPGHLSHELGTQARHPGGPDGALSNLFPRCSYAESRDPPSYTEHAGEGEEDLPDAGGVLHRHTQTYFITPSLIRTNSKWYHLDERIPADRQQQQCTSPQSGTITPSASGCVRDRPHHKNHCDSYNSYRDDLHSVHASTLQRKSPKELKDPYPPPPPATTLHQAATPAAANTEKSKSTANFSYKTDTLTKRKEGGGR
ncbi:hypothetical protein SKAU_G00392300 [Synaphobranchus kaupii]|uniref:Uncharacterized protein n=1 Tax=Synaphobranchus kaupii TaxID=118154 RepID=A0A9Q1EBP3_SYNKA|nr:hypothetical protein SKAU_G00392300 [Synaphobranchus kaupii]